MDFDTLRQTCIDPANRSYLGPQAPAIGIPSQSIARITVSGAKWAATPEIALNPGLVAIIGPRGSGKTALAEMVAMGCDAIEELGGDLSSYPSASFLARARELLQDTEVTLEWRAGDPIVRALDGSTTPDAKHPRARYLSQRFVEELCSATGVTDELLQEIERVVFESHPVEEQDGALDFRELLDRRASRFRQAREREEEAIMLLSDRIGIELEKDREVGNLARQISEKRKRIKAYTADRARLVAKGSEKRAERLGEVASAAEAVRGYLRFYANQEQSLLALQDEVHDLRKNKAPEMLRKSQEQHAASRIKPEDWDPFLIDYTGDVDALIAKLLVASRNSASRWKGTAPAPPESPETQLIGEGA
ncbi:MAG TPA: hypothetical protein VJ837_00315, partial [Candidatus Paceibacterota bacterium]|nr:hypothetical protein [Candidatus Paceibacterota bacterium]